MTTRMDRDFLGVLRAEVQELEEEAERYIEESVDGYEQADHEGHQDAYRTVIDLIDKALAIMEGESDG